MLFNCVSEQNRQEQDSNNVQSNEQKMYLWFFFLIPFVHQAIVAAPSKQTETIFFHLVINL